MKRVKKLFSDFRAFIAKGNILDLAVAVVIGGAFGKIVTSLVNDIITPLIGFALGKVNLADLTFPQDAEVAIRYGAFIQSIIDFFIIALTIFLVLRIIMRSKERLNKSKERFLKQQAKILKLLKKKGASDEEIKKVEANIEEAKTASNLPEEPIDQAVPAPENINDIALKDSKVEELLTQIRDLLANGSKPSLEMDEGTETCKL